MSSISPMLSPRYFWLGISLVVLIFPGPFNFAATSPVDLELRLKPAEIVHKPDDPIEVPTAHNFWKDPTLARPEDMGLVSLTLGPGKTTGFSHASQAGPYEDMGLVSLTLGPGKTTGFSHASQGVPYKTDVGFYSQRPDVGPSSSKGPANPPANVGQYASDNRDKAKKTLVGPGFSMEALQHSPELPKISASPYVKASQPHVDSKAGPSGNRGVGFVLNNARPHFVVNDISAGAYRASHGVPRQRYGADANGHGHHIIQVTPRRSHYGGKAWPATVSQMIQPPVSKDQPISHPNTLQFHPVDFQVPVNFQGAAEVQGPHPVQAPAQFQFPVQVQPRPHVQHSTDTRRLMNSELRRIQKGRMKRVGQQSNVRQFSSTQHQARPTRQFATSHHAPSLDQPVSDAGSSS